MNPALVLSLANLAVPLIAQAIEAGRTANEASTITAEKVAEIVAKAIVSDARLDANFAKAEAEKAGG